MAYYVKANGVGLTFNEVDNGAFICIVGAERMQALLDYSPPMNERSVWDLDLSTRATNCLRAEGIETIGQLIEQLRESSYYLIKVPNIGKRTEREIKDALRSRGLSWGEKQ